MKGFPRRGSPSSVRHTDVSLRRGRTSSCRVRARTSIPVPGAGARASGHAARCGRHGFPPVRSGGPARRAAPRSATSRRGRPDSAPMAERWASRIPPRSRAPRSYLTGSRSPESKRTARASPCASCTRPRSARRPGRLRVESSGLGDLDRPKVGAGEDVTPPSTEAEASASALPTWNSPSDVATSTESVWGSPSQLVGPNELPPTT